MQGLDIFLILKTKIRGGEMKLENLETFVDLMKTGKKFKMPYWGGSDNNCVCLNEYGEIVDGYDEPLDDYDIADCIDDVERLYVIGGVNEREA